MKGSLLIKAMTVLVVAATIVSAAGVGCAPGAAKKEVVLKIGVNDFYGEKLDPIIGTGSTYRILMPMFDTALEIDQNGLLTPGIVKKWELAPDGLSWTFYLRNDVFFHDGVNADGTAAPRTKMTAKDVAFSYQRAVSEEAYYAERWKTVLGDKPRIDIVDDYTLRIYTKGAQPLLPILSTIHNPSVLIVPKDYIEKNGLAYFRAHPIGTGPYKFVRLVPGDLMEFQAVDYDHWWVKPEFTRVIQYLVPEEVTRVAMLEKGQLDATSVSLDTATELKTKGFTILGGQTAQAFFAAVGAYHPLAKGLPLADIRVRQALTLAINRQELINVVFHGMATLPGPPRVALDGPDVTTRLREKWRAWANQNYRYDPAEATRLVKEAGYSNGFTFDLWSAPDSSAPYLGDLALACAGYWERIGAHANIINVDGNTLKANRFTQKSTTLVGKMAFMASGLLVPFTNQSMDRFTSNQGSMDLLLGSPAQAEEDALFTEGLSNLDPVRGEQILDRLIEIAASSEVAIPVIEAPQLFVFGPRVDAKAYVNTQTVDLAPKVAFYKYTGVAP